MNDDLKALRDIISSSVDSITAACEAAGTPFPSLNDPIQPSEFTRHGIRSQPAVMRSISLIVSAATQLIATVRPPPATMIISAFRYTLPAALGVIEAGNVAEILRDAGPKVEVVQPPPATMIISAFRYTLPASLGVVEAGNVAEILRDAGPQGLHINEIASKSGMDTKKFSSKSGMDTKKLSRILRYLATEHWFREVSPDIFANNLLSSLLDSGKEINEGFDRRSKHENSKGMSAMAGYVTNSADECIKSGSYLVEMMTDPNTKFSEEPNCSALQKAFNMTDTFFEFLDRPTEEYRRKRFAIVMARTNRGNTPAAIVESFDWESIPDGGILVDVGGGLGHVALEIAKAHPKLHIVVEDRPLVMDQAKSFWEENLPSHVDENKVHFLGVDFFEEQPKLPGPVDVFLLRNVIHDWPDKYAIKILRHLRNAAGPNTKLLVIDNVLDHVCGTDQDATRPPSPLLPNLGGASLLSYSADVAVFCVLNAGERTIEGFKDILTPSGWKFHGVRKNPISPVFKPAVTAGPA
ncbi:S-adenosyl-L-methionine-dependent methyltransferase [Sanghuangporus baumii]|uniref:S-adenosyl-L-methionine-dependent methyltransferase n=1 Tax=Sanghuangporus baumii TaxID=108892 RepID=A0A9Q5HSQ4_SANBA|nr:S-adenosyl-L-methionine-dependent methyltransferase [Sanghuangporus baumii]